MGWIGHLDYRGAKELLTNISAVYAVERLPSALARWWRQASLHTVIPSASPVWNHTPRLPRRRRADRGYCAVPGFPRGTLTANEVICMKSLSTSSSSGSEGVTSGLVRKPYTEEGVAYMSPVAIGKTRISHSLSYGHNRQRAPERLPNDRRWAAMEWRRPVSTGHCRGCVRRRLLYPAPSGVAIRNPPGELEWADYQTRCIISRAMHEG